MFEMVGAIHVHSVFSDGSGEVPEIAQFGNEAGLDFIIITDHNTLRALKEGYEGWYGNTLILVGYEINDKENKNHLLALNVEDTLSTRMPAKDYVRLVKESGGLGFIAHPHETRNSMKEHPPYPWIEWETNDFTGLEIWNHMSVWMEGLTEQNKFNYFIHPLKSISGPPKETLYTWDKLNLERRVVGIGGVDAHAHKVNLLGFFEVEVFPYKVMFKSIRTHILTDEKIEPSVNTKDISKTKNIFYSALKNGRCFVSNFYHGDACGFRFYAENNDQTYQMGDSIPLNGVVNLKVKLPSVYGTINFIRNGEKIRSMEGTDAAFTVMEKGVYRVEIFLNENPWIFSNHIRIGL